MPGRLEVGTAWRSHARAQDSKAVQPDAPRRLLLLADFSGRGSRSAHDAAQLRQRRPVAVDFESFDSVMRGMRPSLLLHGEVAQFGSLDDFHPDRLTARLSADRPPQNPAPAAAEDTAATVERLLGRRMEAPPPAQPIAAAGAIEALLRQAVANHVVPAPSATPAAQRAASAMALRSLLADQGLQAVEAAWRGVELLLSRLNFDGGLELHLLDCTREELAADLVAASGEPQNTGLLQALTGGNPSPPDSPGWLALIGLFDFDDSRLDLALLAACGRVAQRCAAPFIGGAAPALLQGALQDRIGPDWQTLRHSDAASWLGLAGPRLLLRTPYGRRGEPVESLDFEEVDAAGALDHLLWAPASLLCGLAIGQAVNAGLSDPLQAGAFDADGLPAATTEDTGLLCAQMRVSEQQAGLLHRQGLLALRGHQRRHSLALAGLHSLAAGGRPWGS